MASDREVATKMHSEGHIGAALALYSPLALPLAAFGSVDLVLLLGVAVAGLSMLPDLVHGPLNP